jgi:hypothetical protein
VVRRQLARQRLRDVVFPGQAGFDDDATQTAPALLLRRQRHQLASDKRNSDQFRIFICFNIVEHQHGNPLMELSGPKINDSLRDGADFVGRSHMRRVDEPQEFIRQA